MHAPVTAPAAPSPVEKKHRTITLTNRAPVRIAEDEWETIAEGKYCDEPPYGGDYLLIEIRVRQHKPNPPFNCCRGYIVHAKYELYIEDREDSCQRIRVGHLLTEGEAILHLWKHIAEVGDELRSRIVSDKCRNHVVHAVDQCFASLAPRDA